MSDSASIEIGLRNASDEDLLLLVRMIEEYYRFDHLDFREEVATDAVSTLLGRSDLGHIWIIESTDEPIGYVVLAFSYSLEFHGRKGFIDELYIREGYRRKGVGRQVLSFLFEYCSAAGIGALRLEVEQSNEAAQKLYRSLGFEAHDRYLMTRWL